MEKVEHFFFGKTSRKSWIIGILLLASFLRLYRIQDYMTFLGDEGRDVLVVYNILHGNLTLLGPTASVGGFFLGPIYYYFMAPFLWLFDYNPVGPAIMVAFFGIATVWLTYKVGSEFFGYGTGLIAAFLYSISPLVIAYSRSSWNPNLMPFFSLLSLYVLYKAVSGDKTKLFIFCGLLLGVAMQLHYLSIFLGVIMAAYMLIARIFPAFYSSSDPAQRERREVSSENSSRQARTINFEMGYKIVKDYLYIFLGFVIGWSPFLAFEVRHDFPNIRSIINFVLRGQDTGGNSQFFAIFENVFFRLFGRLTTNFPPPEQVALGAHPNIALWYYATLFLGIASLALLVYKFIKNFKDKDQFQKISLFVVWFVFGVGLFGFYKKPIYDYYFGFLFPLPFLLVGMLISSLMTRKIGKILSVVILASLLWINLQGVPFRYSPNRQLAQVEEISRFVVNKTEGKPYNFALITGGNSDHGYRYFFTLWDKNPIIIENFAKDPQRKTVTEQLLVVCENQPCRPLGHSLWEIAGFGRAEIAEEWDVSVVKVYRLVYYKDVNTSDGGSPE